MPASRSDRTQERNLLWHTRFGRGHSPWGIYCVVPIDQKPPWDGVEHPWFDLLHQSTHPAANPEAYLCVLAKEIAIFPPVVLPSAVVGHPVVAWDPTGDLPIAADRLDVAALREHAGELAVAVGLAARLRRDA